MQLTKISINHFKALKNVSFEPGKVNVFIGANGVGKSSVLEALGILSAAINEQVDDESLYRRGVRLGTPQVYKSSFQSVKRLPNTIEFIVDWLDHATTDHYNYKVNLSNSTDNPESRWSYFAETLLKNNQPIPELTRGQRPKKFPTKNPKDSFDIDKYRGILSFFKNTSKTSFISELYDMFRDYAIYTPSTDTLRGVVTDVSQKNPIGLRGGRLAEAINDLLSDKGDDSDERFGSMDVEDLYELLDWVGKIKIGKPTKDIIPTGVPAPQKVIQFTDRYMKLGKNVLSSYDVSEGALHVLFLLALPMHPHTPKSFAIDNFDQAMNPRLAKATMSLFCEQVIENDRVAFVTTHSPLALDGLDLLNEDIRLFTLDRTKDGDTIIKRVTISEKLNDGSLSRLWLSGSLGGVPKL